jgi:hypothetical protein
MPDVRVQITIPYKLRISDGDYPTTPGGDPIRVVDTSDEFCTRMLISATFFHDDAARPEEIQECRARDASQLLLRTNRLVRWYRAIRKRPDITELTRAEVSPFQFEVIAGTASELWTAPLEYYEKPHPAPRIMTVEELTQLVREGLLSGKYPEDDVLSLLVEAFSALRMG